jgi:hypothetical protein
MTEIVAEKTIWFPGFFYNGREGDYAKPVVELSDEKIVELVQKRAEEDGTWAIENGHVGQNENIMRKMMAWVSKRENIIQALEHIHAENMHTERTVDWLCRELANASKRIGGSSDR